MRPDDALIFLVEHVGLLETFGKRARFVHSSFFEYFFAHHVAESLDSGTLDRRWLAQQWRDRKYSEVIVFSVEIASSEGLAAEAILKEIADATDFVSKSHRVADSELGADGDARWDDDDEDPDITALFSEAGEALAYVVRCGAALGHRTSSKDVERVSLALMNAVLDWFGADYRDGNR